MLVTFGRFFTKLAQRLDMVKECLADLTDVLAEELPGFGETVAVYSTTGQTHSNPSRNPISTPRPVGDGQDVGASQG